MKVTQEQLTLAKTMWEQARDRAALTTAAMGHLTQSRKDLVDSLINLGESHQKAFQEFQKYLDAHWEELQKATDEMNKMSEEYGRIYKKYKAEQNNT